MSKKLFLIIAVILVVAVSVLAINNWNMDTSLSNADASFIGEDANDFSGYSTAGAGDVNGDGYDDFLIGAPYDEEGGSTAGQTYLILGQAGGWNMDRNLSTANASFIGEDAADRGGVVVSGAGDVNGDGYDDFLIGAYLDDDGGSGAGQTYLILGQAGGWTMDRDLSTANASFWGEDASDYSGYSVSGAGDVNNDGYDDFLIGAYGDEDGGSNAGQTYLILGRPTADWSMDVDLSTANASFIGEDDSDRSGWSVSGAGDVNGDGYDDFLIGAKNDDDGGSDAGQTYLILGCNNNSGIYGGSCWLKQDMDLSNANASFIGEDADDYSGYSVSGAGDVNNDGYDDFLIGAFGDEDGGGSYAGQTYLILGQVDGWSMDVDLSTANASFIGEDVSDYSGFSVSDAGDVDGDGYDDFLIGAYYDEEGGSNAGQTYLILGQAGGWTMDRDLSNASASFWGEDAGDYSGCSVSGAGDVDGDGYADFIIGAYYDEDGGSSAGQTYLILGGATANLTINDSAEGSSVETSTSIDFFAYYVNATSGAHISSASCNVSFDDAPSTWYPMTDSGSYYNYTKSAGFSTAATHVWNVTCAKSGFTTLAADDTVSVTSAGGAVPEFSDYAIMFILITVIAGFFIVRKKQ
ncbi:MAG: integrin alpha [Nanoarchaeota archaeon]|nr:integrin alpha [Nanoarchaeota archaeon]